MEEITFGYSAAMTLLPLEVLPGWPEPAPTSDLHLLLLMVLGPLAFGLIVTALAFAPRWVRKDRESSSTELTRGDDA